MLRVGLRVEIFRCAGILLLQWQGETFAHRQHLKVLLLSTCTMCKQKSYISKDIQPIFEIFASTRRCWGWAFGWKVSGAHRYFTFAMARWKLGASTTFEILPTVQPVHSSGKKSYISKGIQPIFEIFASARRCWAWAFGCRNFQLRRYFGFAMARSILCASTTFEILPLSTCTLCQHKSYISKGIQPIFEIFPSARRCWRWAFGWIVLGAQVFYFLQWRGENFAHRQHLKFCHVSTCTLCKHKSYISKDIQAIFEILASARKMLTVAFWVESLRCARVLVLQWQGENFAHRQHFKFCHFQPVHCASRNPISPKVFDSSSKSFRQLEDAEGGHLGGKFQAHRYFTFAMARWKLGASTTFEILRLSTCTLFRKKSYISKGIQPIFEIFASARRCWAWAFGPKLSVAQIF